VRPVFPVGARRRLFTVSVLALSPVGAGIAVAASSESRFPARSLAPLPAPPRPALPVPHPRLLGGGSPAARWAPVRIATIVRRAPDRRAAVITVIRTSTPEGTANIVTVLGRTSRRRGRGLWVHVRLPVLPNGTTGWVPRRALGGYTAVHTRLVVDRRRLRATLLRNGRPLFRAAVGVGKAAWPTPAGTFYVRNRLTRYRSPTYGPLAFGTSARSAVLTDWPAGGYVGIHGTNFPTILPGRVSHGCIRMRNADIVRLGRLMPVGTPLTIR
jgi:L,D-transpeptidase catalytic domain